MPNSPPTKAPSPGPSGRWRDPTASTTSVCGGPHFSKHSGNSLDSQTQTNSHDIKVWKPFPCAGFTWQSPSSAAMINGGLVGGGQVAVNKTNHAAVLSQQKLRIFENMGQHMRCIKLAAQPVDEWEETSNVPPPELHRRSTFPGSTTERTSDKDVI